MTQNALAYLSLQETKRHQLATEKEQQRSNLARETEAVRSNVAREVESNRSAVAREVLESRKHDITQAYNTWVTTEQTRSNMAREFETHRHNVVTEQTANAQTLNSALQGLNQSLGNLIQFKDSQTREYQAETDRLRQTSQDALGWANVGISQQQLAINQQNVQGQINRWNWMNTNEAAQTSLKQQETQSLIQLNQERVKSERNQRQIKWVDVIWSNANNMLRNFTQASEGAARLLQGGRR